MGAHQSVRQALSDADSLGADVLKRIESSEPLSVIVPAARRFFVLVADRPLAAWLQLEAAGLETDQRKADERDADERTGALLFAALRRAQEIADFDVDRVIAEAGKPASKEFPKRGAVMYQSLAELESRTLPIELTGSSRQNSTMITAWAALKLQYDESRRILNLVRQTLHRLVLERHERVRADRALSELFGADALVVFAAGGGMLAELRAAAMGAYQSASASSIGQQARTALMTLGRELYSGSGESHRSPISGRVFEARQEMNKLHVVLDDLWESAPNRRRLLEEAHAAADLAYELGSKAKNPTAITHDEAIECLRAAFRVAHAICFAGGFPTESERGG